MEHDLQKKQEVPNRNYQTISRSKKTAQAVRRKKARKRRIRFYRLMAIIRIILCLIGAHTVADTIYGWVHKPPEKEEAVVGGVSLPAQNDEIAFEEYDITLMAVGDNLLHMGISWYKGTNCGYFSRIYSIITALWNVSMADSLRSIETALSISSLKSSSKVLTDHDTRTSEKLLIKSRSRKSFIKDA